MANAEMAKRILKIIEKKPEAFSMWMWIDGFDSENVEEWDADLGDYVVPDDAPMTFRLDLQFDADGNPLQEVNVCGSTLCVSGWAIALDGWTFSRDEELPSKNGKMLEDWTEEGQRILGLTYSDADILFGTSNYVAVRALQQIADGADHIDWDSARSYDN
jgi:hypothetical protein